VAIDRALDDVKNKRTGEVPMHLRNAVTSGMKELGYGRVINMPMIIPAISLTRITFRKRLRGLFTIIPAQMVMN